MKTHRTQEKHTRTHEVLVTFIENQYARGKEFAIKFTQEETKMTFQELKEYEFETTRLYIEEHSCNMNTRILRKMWTVFCHQWNLEVDTAEYDERILILWETCIQNDVDLYFVFFETFEDFDNYMAEELV